MNEISALLSGAFHIELEFTCDSDPNAHFRVSDANVSEALSETYRAEISLMTEDAVDPPAMLGRNGTFLIRRGGAERALRGIVTRIEQGGVVSVGTTSAMVLRVTLEPALCALKHTRDSRIFPNQKIVDIVNEVLGKALSPYGRSIETKNLKTDYPEREYTVQYEESDYDFVARLLAQEGISYFFDHSDKVEKLILADDKADYVTFQSVDGQPVPIVQRADENPDTEPVLSFVRADRMGTTSVVVRDYDWTHPAPPGPKVELLVPDPQGRERIAYASTGETNIGKYVVGEKAYTEHDIAARATRLRERLVSHELAFTGEGLVSGFMPGVVFELTDHPLPELDGKYLVTSVVHIAGALAGRDENADRYRNYFTAIPFDVPFRPATVTPWPRIHSIQTATVVGPADAEMHTDEHGRIRVQFHWDRLGKRDDHSSCFIRVAQTTAGPSYGFMFIPRIGMEVLVSFIEGNPDRPLVTGCVYNGQNRPFYTLDDTETRSVIRTRTFGTDAASGTKFNELSFNDAPDAEEIFTHASRDYREVVEHDHNTLVHGKQSNTVDKSHSESVGGSQSLSVGGDRSVTITGSENRTITGKQAAGGVKGGSLNITGDYKLDTSNTINVQAPVSIKLECGGSSLLIEPGKITMTAGDGSSVVLDANAVTTSSQGSKVAVDANVLSESSGGSKVLLDANVLNESSGGSKVVLDANALAQSSGGSKVVLDANVLNESSGGAQVVLDANALLKGAEATVKGDASAQLDAGGNVKADPSGVTIMGSMVKIN